MTGASAPEPEVEVRRSKRRRRTVAAYREDGKVVVLIPARMSRAQEREWVATMLARLERSERRARPSDETLQRRAEQLNHQYLHGAASPASVRWASNQQQRWGSCTPADRSVRLSTRLRGLPPWVIDYVLLHELAHLIEPGHDQRFWSLVERYPKAERAKGFLEGVATARAQGAADDVVADDVVADDVTAEDVTAELDEVAYPDGDEAEPV